MFGRPIPIWLILAYLAYIALGTVWNLASAIGGGASYSALHTLFGAVMAGLAIWLAIQIWYRRSLILQAALANLGFTVFYYALIASGYASRGLLEGIVAVAVTATIISAIWIAIYFYLKSHVKSQA